MEILEKELNLLIDKLRNAIDLKENLKIYNLYTHLINMNTLLLFF